jgi:hypothetical protein
MGVRFTEAGTQGGDDVNNTVDAINAGPERGCCWRVVP